MSIDWLAESELLIFVTYLLCILLWSYNFWAFESICQHVTWIISAEIFLRNELFFLCSVTNNLKLAWTRLAWPCTSDYQQAGHLGGLGWIKSCFSVSPPAPPSQGRGHGSKQGRQAGKQTTSSRAHYSKLLSTRPHGVEAQGPGTECSRLWHKQGHVSALKEFHRGWGNVGDRWTGWWFRGQIHLKLCLITLHKSFIGSQDIQ